ncbi:MAG: class I SAM-dependent methyltransferase [Candidatus Izimaplasma sp.]|nr:class I SAM-dependent methyltransferase [Candidatus Izimaplasma bacterium]
MDYKETKDYWNKVFKKLPFKALKEIKTNIKPIDEGIDWLSQDSESVLDFGCGTGKLLLMAAKSNNGFYHGIDISIESIKYAKKLFSNYKINNALFEVGSIEKLHEIESNKYDAIILSNIIDNLEPNDGKLLVKEVHRLLKPNGKVFLKINDYLNKQMIKEQEQKLIKDNFYVDDDSLYLWNLSTKQWKEFFKDKFTIYSYERIYYESYEQYNRLFLLEKK